MKKFIFCILLVMGQQLLMAQKLYFVYFQSENRQSFYLKMGAKTMNSGNGGYLILPKLRDSVYHITIGSSENKYPEQAFTIVVNKKDHGYLLKDMGGTGLGLFDLQSFELLKTETIAPKKEEAKIGDGKNVSLFTEVLAKAADDPSLKEKTARAEPKPEIKLTEIKPAEIKKTEVTKTEEKLPGEKVVVKTEPKAIVVPEKDTQALVIQPMPEKKKEIRDTVERVITEPYQRSTVKRRAESSTTEGMGIVYTDDMGNGTVDTIRILIPSSKQPFVAKKDVPREEKKFLNVDSVNLKEEGKVVEIKQPVKDSVKAEEKTVAKIDCKEKAGQDDFFKLRKSMAAVASDDEMMAEARRYFQMKCFSTQQVKNLGALFLNEEGKFNFFKSAQAYISDKENFSSLQSELKEEKYIQLFKDL